MNSGKTVATGPTGFLAPTAPNSAGVAAAAGNAADVINLSNLAAVAVSVTLAAMRAVFEAERAAGREPRDVSADKVGWDVESREPGGRLRFIEVKGRPIYVVEGVYDVAMSDASLALGTLVFDKMAVLDSSSSKNLVVVFINSKLRVTAHSFTNAEIKGNEVTGLVLSNGDISKRVSFTINRTTGAVSGAIESTKTDTIEFSGTQAFSTRQVFAGKTPRVITQNDVLGTMNGQLAGINGKLAIKSFLTRSGVPFEPPATLSFDGTRLIVTQSPKNLDRVKNIIRRYSDIKQVHIEAKFIEVEQKALNELGVNWTLAPTAGGNGNVNAASAFRLAANRVRLWQEEVTYSAHQFVKLPGDRRYRIEVDPTATDPETIDGIKVVETIKEGVTIFDIASMKKAGASIRSGDAGELAFTRAMASTASHLGHHDDHAHGGGCLCGAMSQLAAIIAGAEEK